MPNDRPFIPQPNGGAVGQAATLLNAGIQGVGEAIYQTSEKDRRQRDQDAELLQKGLLRDPDPKSSTYNQVKRDPGAEAAYQQDIHEKDAKSPESQLARQIYIAALRQSNPGLARAITNDMSAYQLKLYEKQLGGLIGKQASALPAQQRFGLAQGNQAVRAADTFDKDRIITNLTERQQQIQRDKHTLETAQVLTPQIFNEIQIGVANAISGGKSAAVSTQDKVEFRSLENDFQNLKQRLTNSPQDIGSPEVKKYMADLLGRLDAAYQNNMASRAQSLMQGREAAYSNNPTAQRVLREKAGSYKPAPGLLQSPEDRGGSGLPSKDDLAAEMKRRGLSQ